MMVTKKLCEYEMKFYLEKEFIMKKIWSLLLALIFTFSSFIFTACGTTENPNEPQNIGYIPTKAVLTTSDGIYTVMLEFTENHLISQKTLMKSDKIFRTTEYTYDSSNKLIQLVHKKDDDKISSVTEHIYDSNGMNTQSVSKNANGQTDSIINKQYNSNGQLKMLSDGLKPGNSVWKTVFLYDDNGNLTKVIGTDHNGITTVVNNTYDSNGKLIEKTLGTDKYTYTYDSDGRLIKVVGPGQYALSLCEEYVTYTLAYDSNGNISEITITTNTDEKYTYTFEYEKVTLPQNIEIPMDALIDELYVELSVLEISI